MRTWFGIIGGLCIGLLVIIALVVNKPGPTRPELQFEDGGVVQEHEEQQEYKLWRPEDTRISDQDSFGEGWENRIIHDKNVAEKYKKPTDAPSAQPKGTPSDARAPVEYVQVGDMWKSNKKIELNNWESTPEEDAVKKTIRAFGNAVGTKIQGFTISHGTQNDRLGAFVIERSESDKKYIESLANDYDNLARSIEGIDSPSAFSEEHKAFVAGYHSIADGLRVLKRATDDKSTYEHMLTYNTHVEEFAESFVPFALLFRAQGVEFTENEPGGIFTPPITQQ